MKRCKTVCLYIICAYIGVVLVNWIFNGFVFPSDLFQEAIPNALGIASGWLIADWLTGRKQRKG